MAQEIEVKVKVVTEQAVNNVDALGNAFDQTAKDAQDAQKVFAKAGNGVEVEQSIAGLKQLKRELKNVAVGSEEFKKLYNDIDDLEDKLKSAKNTSADWVDSLEQAGGPLGMLGTSINKVKVATQTFGGALKATGIGLVVALLAGLAGAFANNEGAMKKLQPLLDGVSKLFQGVFRAVEPLFNTLVDLAISALPMVSKAFGVVYSTMTATLQSFGAIGSAIGKLIKGDFSGAWETAKSSVNDFGKNYDASLKRFSDGSKELTKGEKEQSDKRAEDRKAAQTKREEEEQKARDKALEDKKAYLAKANAFDEENDLKAVDTDKINKEKGILAMQEDLAKKIIIGENWLAEQKRMGEEEVADAQIASEAKLKIKNDEIAALNELGNLLGILAGKNKAMQKAALIAQSAASIASIIVNTNVGSAKEVATKGIFGLSTSAILYAKMGLSIGSVVAATAKGLGALGGGSVGSGSSISTPSSGGGIATPATVQASPSVVAPSGVNQLASTLGQNVPIKAYVVSKDMTSQQSLDRNITDTASIG